MVCDGISLSSTDLCTGFSSAFQLQWECFFVITSSNGNIFHVIGPLWGESTGHRAIIWTNEDTSVSLGPHELTGMKYLYLSSGGMFWQKKLTGADSLTMATHVLGFEFIVAKWSQRTHNVIGLFYNCGNFPVPAMQVVRIVPGVVISHQILIHFIRKIHVSLIST